MLSWGFWRRDGQRSWSRVRFVLAGGAVVRLACLVAVVLVGVLVLPAGASAEPLCTGTWTGPGEGEWTTAADWSAGVPVSTSVACVGAGKTVRVTGGSDETGVVQGGWVAGDLWRLAETRERP
jgi:hypothetical protein